MIRRLRARPARSLTLLACAGLVCANAVLLAPTAASAVAPGGAYQPLAAPQRVLDTRHATGVPGTSPVPSHGTVTLSLGAALAEASVVLNVTVTQPTTVGNIVVYPSDVSSVPTVSNLNFVGGQTVANLVVVRASSAGKVNLYNQSGGSVHLIADLAGHFSPGSGTAQGSYVPLPAPQRMIDTRTTTAVGPKSSIRVALGTKIVPGAGAAVVNVTVVGPTAPGYVAVYADGASRPSSSNVNFVAGQTVPNLAVTPVSPSGAVQVYNASGGSVNVIVDLSGSFVGGDPVAVGDIGALSPVRLLDTRYGNGAPQGAVGAGHTLTLTVDGRGGVPRAAVSAVILNVTATASQRSGYVTVWDGSGSVPNASNLNFAAGQTVPNLVVAPVSPAGTVALHNGSSGTVQLIADVFGYVLSNNLVVPATSTGRYVRNISGSANDAATMHAEGTNDAAGGSKLVLLDIGAQLNDKSGVELSATSTRLTYAQLVTALQAYLDGFGSVSGATVAISTNNDAKDWTTYTAAMRGADWATKVINLLTPSSGVTVVGADDIEAGFASTELQAEQWETAYLLSAMTKKLIFNGSADGCPTSYGVAGTSCQSVTDDTGIQKTWTQAQYNKLAGGLDPTRIQALPQIYFTSQAVQWANIYATGGQKIVFAGALTEHASACGSFCAMTPSQGWAVLYHALSTVVATPTLPAVTDLRIS